MNESVFVKATQENAYELAQIDLQSSNGKLTGSEKTAYYADANCKTAILGNTTAAWSLTNDGFVAVPGQTGAQALNTTATITAAFAGKADTTEITLGGLIFDNSTGEYTQSLNAAKWVFLIKNNELHSGRTVADVAPTSYIKSGAPVNDQVTPPPAPPGPPVPPTPDLDDTEE
jgi:hypothetical protein